MIQGAQFWPTVDGAPGSEVALVEVDAIKVQNGCTPTLAANQVNAGAWRAVLATFPGLLAVGTLMPVLRAAASCRTAAMAGLDAAALLGTVSGSCSDSARAPVPANLCWFRPQANTLRKLLGRNDTVSVVDTTITIEDSLSFPAPVVDSLTKGQGEKGPWLARLGECGRQHALLSAGGQQDRSCGCCVLPTSGGVGCQAWAAQQRWRTLPLCSALPSCLAALASCCSGRGPYVAHQLHCDMSRRPGRPAVLASGCQPRPPAGWHACGRRQRRARAIRVQCAAVSGCAPVGG